MFDDSVFWKRYNETFYMSNVDKFVAFLNLKKIVKEIYE